MRRLAAQQLGLLSLVAELQEGWQQAGAAWCSGGSAPPGAHGQELPQTFGEAALAASHAVAAAIVNGGDGGSSSATSAGDVLAALASADDWLEALSGDDFPRQLSWSEGLCGLTLLPSSLFDGRLPVAAWPENGGRPCLVPLANLWRQRVSSLPPQLD